MKTFRQHLQEKKNNSDEFKNYDEEFKRFQFHEIKNFNINQ